MTTSAEQARTALELVAEAMVRVRLTDPTDTAASLLAAWHGFATAGAAGRHLAQDNLDDAVLAHNAAPVMAAMDALLREAPSLPYTDLVTETVNGLIPDGIPMPATGPEIVYHDPDQPVDNSPAGLVRQAIRALALELNTLLPQAAEHAGDPADRAACEHGTRLAYELCCCWEGRLRSFLNHAVDLSAPARPHRKSWERGGRKRTKNAKKRT
jgi:hypothetical protein